MMEEGDIGLAYLSEIIVKYKNISLKNCGGCTG